MVKNGAFKDAKVENLLEVSRKIVGHFKHSSLAAERLKDIQNAENLPQHTLLQVCVVIKCHIVGTFTGCSNTVEQFIHLPRASA